VCEFVGPFLFGVAVATTIGHEVVAGSIISNSLILGALFSAIVWNIATWYIGIPSSSSHALIGGLAGSAVMTNLLIQLDAGTMHAFSDVVSLVSVIRPGGMFKVVLALLISPPLGFLAGFLLIKITYFFARVGSPRKVNWFFKKGQLVTSVALALSHGTNDAQKTMGIIALALAAATSAGAFDRLPAWLYFLHSPAPPAGQSLEIAAWIKVLCALTMCAGTAAGGWRIIRTLGHKMVKLHPVHGFAAEATGASVLLAAAHFGMPVSTTHAITTSIMGVGCAKGFNALRLGVVERIVWAWVLTIPASGAVGYGLVRLAKTLGWLP